MDQNSKLRHQSRDTFAIKAEVVRFECPGQLHSCADREIFLKSAFCDTFHASVTGSLLDGSSSPPDLGFLLLCAVPRCAASSPGAGRSSRTDATDGRFPEPGAHYRIDTIEPRIVSGHTRRAPEATRIRADAPRRIPGASHGHVRPSVGPPSMPRHRRRPERKQRRTTLLGLPAQGWSWHTFAGPQLEQSGVFHRIL